MQTTGNPHERPAPTAAAAKEKENGVSQVDMGPQSQRHLTLDERKHQLQSNGRKKRSGGGGQQTLFGDRAFDPLKDCEMCKGKPVGRAVHRAHHSLCYNKRGGTSKSAAAMASQEEAKRLEVLFATLLTEAKKCSCRHLTEEVTDAHFGPQVALPGSSATTTTEIESAKTMTMSDSKISNDDFCKGVTTLLQEPKFVEAHESSRAPLPMLAFAEVVMEKVVKSGLINNHDFFDGIAIEVPARKDALMPPQCHSIDGQKLLCAGWHEKCRIGNINCLRCKRGIPINDRTNFSKNPGCRSPSSGWTELLSGAWHNQWSATAVKPGSIPTLGKSHASCQLVQGPHVPLSASACWMTRTLILASRQQTSSIC